VIPPAQSEAEYDSIYAAVAETARGRWFLTEYARRNRPSDTESSLATIARIEAALRVETAAQSLDRFRFDVLDLAQAIVRTKAEIAAMKPDAVSEGKVEDATGDVPEAAAKAIALLSDLENRINAVIDAWGEPPLAVAEISEAQMGGEPAPIAGAEEQMPAEELSVASAGERQDATLEDISRFMMALEPLVASAQAEALAQEEDAAQEPLAGTLTEDTQVLEAETVAMEVPPAIEIAAPEAAEVEAAVFEVRPILEIPASDPPSVEADTSSADEPFALEVEPPAIAEPPAAEVEAAAVVEAPAPEPEPPVPEPAREEERSEATTSIFGRIQAVLHLLPKPAAQVVEASAPTDERPPAPVAKNPVEFLPAAEFESFSAPVERGQPAAVPVIEAEAAPIELEPAAPETEEAVAAPAPPVPDSSPEPEATEEPPPAAVTEMVPPVFAALEFDSDDFLFGPEPKAEAPAPKEEIKTADRADELEPADFLLGPAPDMPQPPPPIAAAPEPEATVARNSFEDLLAEALEMPGGPEPASQPPELMPMAQMTGVAAAIAATAATPIMPPKQPLKSPARMPNDPLAQLRALSDEEKIALFS
jgi:hypothetical protein